MDIRSYLNQPVTVLVDGHRIYGTLDVVDSTGIIVDGWRILMSRVGAWSPGKGLTETDLFRAST